MDKKELVGTTNKKNNIMKRKYELTDETMELYGATLYRIKASCDFNDVKAGDLGGWVENEDNLSHCDNAWVYNDARIYGNARVYGDAKIYGDAEIYGNAKIFGNAEIYNDAEIYGNARVYGDAQVGDNAWVYDNARVYGNAWVFGDAWVYGNAEVGGDARVNSNRDYIVFKDWWDTGSGRYFTWTRSNDKWKVGDFYGTGDELVNRAYQHSETSGREYARVVEYVNHVKDELLENKKDSK